MEVKKIATKDRDGKDRSFDIVGSPIENGSDRFDVLVQLRDVKEGGRTGTDRPLSENEARYRGVFEGIQLPVCVYRFVYGPDGEVEHWTLEDTNPTGLRLLDKGSLEDVIGKNETELFGPNNRAQRLSLVRRLKGTGAPIDRGDVL